jgi:hypothetical protein
MGPLRRLAQALGLVYRDDGTWRPAFVKPPKAAPAPDHASPPEDRVHEPD